MRETNKAILPEQVASIDSILRSIIGNYPDTIQDTWLEILKNNITDIRTIKDIAHKHKRNDAYHTMFHNRIELSLDRPISHETKRTFADILPSPEPVDETELVTRKFTSNNTYSKLDEFSLSGQIKADFTATCKSCNSRRVVKYGTYKGVQKFICKVCGHVFHQNGALYRMQYPRYIIQKFIELRTVGFSFAQITYIIYRIYKVKITDAQLCHWSKKFGIQPKHRAKQWRKNTQELLSKLTSKTYLKEELYQTCGYSTQTKLQDTQLYKLGIAKKLSDNRIVITLGGK